MNDPKLAIKNLIRDSWEPANTSNVTPNIHTGWVDAKSTLIQVTVTESSEVSQSGGITGYIGIAVNGAPAQLWVGSVNVNCWLTRDKTSVNPKQLLFQMKEELRRIVKENYESISDLQWISWRGGMEMVDDTQSPVVYRWAGEIGYAYLD